MNSDRPHLLTAPQLRRNLLKLGRLQFTPALEFAFQNHLRASQRRSATFTLLVAIAGWLFFTGADLWRLQALQGSGHESTFFWGSMVLRWPVLALFIVTYGVIRRWPQRGNWYDSCIVLSLLACSLVIPSASYTLKNLGMTETSVVLVALISLVFFPLGVRLRVMAPVAVVVALVITLSGPALLRQPEHLSAHWVLSAVVWLTLVLSGVTGYYRECGLREQFVLRRLLEWESLHDPLTGLANRRRYNEHMEMSMRQAQRDGMPLYLVILDLDHFKLYNDHYGHNAGDEVLRQIAALMQQFAQRPLDLATRLGGEEFGLVIYGMSPSQIEVYLQEFMDQLHILQLPHAKSPIAGCVTLSLGAAWVHPHDTPDSAFQRADALLYQAKHLGRNRACVQVHAAEGAQLPPAQYLRTVLPSPLTVQPQVSETALA